MKELLTATLLEMTSHDLGVIRARDVKQLILHIHLAQHYEVVKTPV